jgi:hypothetical protein
MAATNIQFLTPAQVATPSVGDVTYFFDTTNNNQLSYKDDLGNVYVYNGSPESIQQALIGVLGNTMSDLTCALKTGIITATEYNSIIAAGLTLTSGDGVTTYTVSMA